MKQVSIDRWRWWAAVGAAAFAGLVLRLVAARGGLWTDEAWSMIYATQAGDPLGVFLRINHDNNHHLYSLWLQAIGIDAPPLLARAPAVVAGTLSIPLAALAVERRSALGGIVAAILVAVSPTFVTFGSEARGYAPMLLAALAFLLLATEVAEGKERTGARWLFALAAALGMFAHLTMAAPVALTALWFYLDRRAALGPRAAARAALWLMGPALAATLAVVGFVAAAAAASPTGMRLGGYVPFRMADFVAGLDGIVGWTLGVTAPAPGLIPLAIALIAGGLVLRPPQWLGARGRLYALLILGVPVGAALIQPGNVGFSRYYLCSAIGLLLLAAETVAHVAQRRGRSRAWAAAALTLLIGLCLWRDWQLVDFERGRPGEALDLIAANSPSGARVALNPKRLEAMIAVPAHRAGYALAIVHGCESADYVLAAVPLGIRPAAAIQRCGQPLRLIGGAQSSSLSGEPWALYRAESLQSAQPPVSGPLPGAPTARLSGRAGVAQG